MRALDHGAYGVVCPLVNTREEADRFISATRYPPLGGRSWGPVRAALHAGEGYAAKANDTIIAIAMIETKQAVENLDDILDAENLDAILVGPNDLGLSYGNLPCPMPEDPEVIAAMKLIAKKAAAKGIMAGIHCGDVDMARKMMSWGYRFTSISTDQVILNQACAKNIADIKSSSPPTKTSHKAAL
jgi:4-hydroxy-2-oxoheptanedioate aldolase